MPIRITGRYRAGAKHRNRAGLLRPARDDLAAAVDATMGTGAMALLLLAALRTGHRLRCGQGVVRTALVALAHRRSSLGYSHLVLFVALSAFVRGSSCFSRAAHGQ